MHYGRLADRRYTGSDLVSLHRFRNHDEILQEIETLIEQEKILCVRARRVYRAAVQNPDVAPFLSQQSYQRGTIYVSMTLLNEGWTNISDTQVGIWEKPVGCKVRA